MLFKSKADTLESLSAGGNHFKVLPLVKFTWEDWLQNKRLVLERVAKRFLSERLIVRSSAYHEDKKDQSGAGKYLSVGNVRNEVPDLEHAIERVFASYENPTRQDYVFVQEFLSEIRISGVAFTADADTLAPYYIVNYDESGSSDSVTSGSGAELRTYVEFKQAPVTPNRTAELNKLIGALNELEMKFPECPLDVEFAVLRNLDVYVFQVRPLVTDGKSDLRGLDYKNALAGIYKKAIKLSVPHPNLLGHKTLFGVMPDWNPAEIIGVKPKPLAVSLYKEIITDSIWAYQRDNYGYRNLRSHPLMIMLLGVPYIDVRVDFNSFIPKELDSKVSGKLTEYYLDKLSKFPAFHDKVEFEIVHSCFHFNLEARLSELRKEGFSSVEIRKFKDALLQLTNRIIDPKFGHYKRDVEKVEELKRAYDRVDRSDMALVDKIYWLLEDCKRYGTLPFAGIARSAFIATQLLQSLVAIGVFTKEDYQAFTGSLNTITRKLAKDLSKMKSGQLSRADFLKRYGHLRPGTYDILSRRYDENFDEYFGNLPDASSTHRFVFTKRQQEQIRQLIRSSGLKITFPELHRFIKGAIENREYAKYVFTRSVSKVLSLIEELGLKNGVRREDLPFLDIKTILKFYSSLDFRLVRDVFRQDVESNKESFKYTTAVRFPQLISEAGDIYSFFLSPDEPNYITLKKSTAGVLREEDFFSHSFQGRIAFIKSADPGYDYLFTKGIAGLVTQFGGANSHMAIRCSELGLPAVIGCGEKNFSTWGAAEMLEIDCAARTVRIIQ